MAICDTGYCLYIVYCLPIDIARRVAVGLACSPSQISKKVIKHPQMMYIEWVCGGIWSGAAGSAPLALSLFPADAFSTVPVGLPPRAFYSRMRYNSKNRRTGSVALPGVLQPSVAGFLPSRFPFEKKAFLDWASYQNGQEAAELAENQHGAQGC